MLLLGQSRLERAEPRSSHRVGASGPDTALLRRPEGRPSQYGMRGRWGRTLRAPARHRWFCQALQLILRALHLAEHMMIVRIDPLIAARHAFVAGGEHLTRVLFPDSESVEFFFAGEIAILNQFVGRRVVRLRVFNFINF